MGAHIERPYSCAPQAVGAVYDRPGFFVQSRSSGISFAPSASSSIRKPPVAFWIYCGRFSPLSSSIIKTTSLSWTRWNTRKWCSRFPKPLERKYSLKPASCAADSPISSKIHALLRSLVHPLPLTQAFFGAGSLPHSGSSVPSPAGSRGTPPTASGFCSER